MNCARSIIRPVTVLASLLALAVLAVPRSALACAACFGQSDSKMADGMNMGIFSLLVIITGVLFGFACFFVFLARRAAAHSSVGTGHLTDESSVSTHSAAACQSH